MCSLKKRKREKEKKVCACAALRCSKGRRGRPYVVSPSAVLGVQQKVLGCGRVASCVGLGERVVCCALVRHCFGWWPILDYFF